MQWIGRGPLRNVIPIQAYSGIRIQQGICCMSFWMEGLGNLLYSGSTPDGKCGGLRQPAIKFPKRHFTLRPVPLLAITNLLLQGGQ